MKPILALLLGLCWCGLGQAETVSVLKHMITHDVYVNRCVFTSSQTKLIGDAEIVMQTLAMESASEPSGMPFVAVTLYNRALKRGTSMSVEAQRAYQYSCWNNEGKWAKTWLSKHYSPKTRLEARNALEMGMEIAVKHPSLRHYCTIKSRPSWAKGKTPAFILGEHRWYEGVK